jgi:hypothetical protein
MTRVPPEAGRSGTVLTAGDARSAGEGARASALAGCLPACVVIGWSQATAST